MNYRKKTAEKNSVNIYKIEIALLFSALIISVIISAGCIQDTEDPVPEQKTYDITPIPIPNDIHTGIHEFYHDIAFIGLSISADLHSVSEKIVKQNTRLGKENALFDYYSDNAWINSVVYYDAVNDEFITSPLILNEEIINAIPVPEMEEFDESADGIVKKKCVFIPENGYLNLYYKACYNSNDEYVGYVVILFDLYSEMLLHPMIIDSETSYRDYVCYLTDSDGKIIFSSRDDAVGKYITADSAYDDEVSLIIAPTESSGAYTYLSNSFYNYDNSMTEKVTAWHVYNIWGEVMTIYLVGEVDSAPLEYENIYTTEISQMIKDVTNFYYFVDTNGLLKSMERLESGYYESDIRIIDMDGNIVSAFDSKRIGNNLLNNRDIYGYLYAQTTIASAKQGGGYVYFCYPVDSRLNSPAYKLELGYVIPIGNDLMICCFVSGSSDLYDDNQNLNSDLTKLSREILKKAHENSVYRVITLINSDPENAQEFFLDDLETDVGDIAIFDYEGNVYASTYDPNTVGSVLTNRVDIFGGSVIRKNIMLAKNGGGFLMDLLPSDEEGYLDLWLINVEPVNDNYFIDTSAIIGTFEDEITGQINL